MEWLEKTLDKLKAPNSRIKSEDLHNLMKSMLENLAFYESKSAYHGDIKPENIMIDSMDRSKLIDFGTSKMASSQEFEAEHYGTEGFYNPVIMNAPVLTMEERHKNDQFMLGMTLLDVAALHLSHTQIIEQPKKNIALMVSGGLTNGPLFQRSKNLFINSMRDISREFSPKVESIIFKLLRGSHSAQQLLNELEMVQCQKTLPVYLLISRKCQTFCIQKD